MLLEFCPLFKRNSFVNFYGPYNMVIDKLISDEWKRMKETNSVPAWEEEAKPDEVLVQTSTGLFKFQGNWSSSKKTAT